MVMMMMMIVTVLFLCFFRELQNKDTLVDLSVTWYRGLSTHDCHSVCVQCDMVHCFFQRAAQQGHRGGPVCPKLQGAARADEVHIRIPDCCCVQSLLLQNAQPQRQ